MYEVTPLSRGESLDPNPLGQGEYIEHRHPPITCNSGLRSFPMLKVGLLAESHIFIMWYLLSVIWMLISINCHFQKAKADPLPVSPPVNGGVPVRKKLMFFDFTRKVC